MGTRLGAPAEPNPRRRQVILRNGSQPTMFEQSTSQRLAGVDQGRRPLDLAEGIVMTLRRTDPASAFAEMISVAADHGVTVLALARALINLVGGPAGLPCDARARHAALQRWGPALQ